MSNFRHSAKLPDRPLRYVESSGSPLFDTNANKIGAMVIIRDITNRYQHEFEITDAVIEAAEKERMHIASELHDSIMQELSKSSRMKSNLFCTRSSMPARPTERWRPFPVPMPKPPGNMPRWGSVS